MRQVKGPIVSAALFKYDLALLLRHGFVAAYAVIGVVYAAIAASLPQAWGNAVLPVMVWSDPVFFGFFFAGATVCLDLAQGSFQALVATPLRPAAYIMVKAVNLGLLAFAMALGISIAVRGLSFRPLVMLVGVLLGVAPSALVGAALALRLGSINRFMMAAIPVLIWFSLPIPVYALGQLLPAWMPWLARLSPSEGALRWSIAAFTSRQENLHFGSLVLAALESLVWTILAARFALAPAIAATREG